MIISYKKGHFSQKATLTGFPLIAEERKLAFVRDIPFEDLRGAECVFCSSVISSSTSMWENNYEQNNYVGNVCYTFGNVNSQLFHDKIKPVIHIN